MFVRADGKLAASVSEGSTLTLIGLLLSATVACGRLEPMPEPGASTSTGVSEFLPLATGNTWTYRVTDGTDVTTKVTTVGALEAVGAGPHADVQAYSVVTEKDNSGDETQSWQGPVEAEGGVEAVRYREISFSASTGLPDLDEYWDPYKLRVDDYHRVADGQWLKEYDETKEPDDEPATTKHHFDTWVVLSDDELVTVPAGQFHTLMVKRIATKEGDPDKIYWFARGLGKVKEAGGQIEELVSCEVLDPDTDTVVHCEGVQP